MFLNTRLTSDLVQLRRAGLGRKLTLPNGLDFSSNDYLGLANHPLLRQLLVEALEKACRLAVRALVCCAVIRCSTRIWKTIFLPGPAVLRICYLDRVMTPIWAFWPL